MPHLLLAHPALDPTVLRSGDGVEELDTLAPSLAEILLTVGVPVAVVVLVAVLLLRRRRRVDRH